MIISNFSPNLTIFPLFFSFFFHYFFRISNFGHFWAIFLPPIPQGYQNFSSMELNLSKQLLRWQTVSKNCSMTSFFHVNSVKTIIWSFPLFFAILGAFRGACSLMGGTYRAAYGPELHHISPH